jgi:signal peptidase I
LVAQLVALGCVVGLGHFAAEPMRVSSTSMVPTFRSGDQMLVDKLDYREDQPAVATWWCSTGRPTGC